MKKYSHIILAFIILAILGACDDSLGTDPDYKTTIFDKDTIIMIDTVIQRDTVLSDDTLKFLFTIDSLITTRDSLGVVIDSLSRVISDTSTRIVAPRFRMVVDSVIPSVTYVGFDTVFDVNQQPVIIRSSKESQFIPNQDNFDKIIVEMDTNLNRNRAWINMTLDGNITRIDSNINFAQQVYLNTTNIKIDSVHIYDIHLLVENGNNFTHTTSLVDYKFNDIISSSLRTVTLKFERYLFDSESKLIGYWILVDMSFEARGTQLSNPQSNYQFRVVLRYP